MPRLKQLDFEGMIEECYERFQRDKPDTIAIDTETTGLGYFDSAFAASLAWDGFSGYIELEADSERVLDTILRRSKTWVFQNGKFDLQKLILADRIKREDVLPERLHDTEAIAHLLDPEGKKGLKPLAERYLNATTDETKRLRLVRRKLKIRKQDSFATIPRHHIVPYAKRDAEYTYRLFKRLHPELSRRGKNLYKLYRSEIELSLVLLDMEAAGMGVDVDYVDKQIKILGREIVETKQAIEALVDRPLIHEGVPARERLDYFNPQSPVQLLQALRLRGMDVSGTSKEMLLPVADDPLVACITRLRRLSKLRGTYLKPILEEQREGIIHPSFRQHGTRTGRMSSGGSTE